TPSDLPSFPTRRSSDLGPTIVEHAAEPPSVAVETEAPFEAQPAPVRVKPAQKKPEPEPEARIEPKKSEPQKVEHEKPEQKKPERSEEHTSELQSRVDLV